MEEANEPAQGQRKITITLLFNIISCLSQQPTVSVGSCSWIPGDKYLFLPTTVHIYKRGQLVKDTELRAIIYSCFWAVVGVISGAFFCFPTGNTSKLFFPKKTFNHQSEGQYGVVTHKQPQAWFQYWLHHLATVSVLLPRRVPFIRLVSVA